MLKDEEVHIDLQTSSKKEETQNLYYYSMEELYKPPTEYVDSSDKEKCLSEPDEVYRLEY